MFDTMTITKAVAGVCSALLIFLVGGWIADTVYMPHGAAPVAYVIDTGSDDAPAEEATEEEAVDIDALYAAADPEAGAAQWRNCRACHSLEAGRNGQGPSLHGVVGREIDAMAGFNYSGALLQLGDTWTVAALNQFLASPRAAAPGTTMNFIGLRNQTDRLNLIAYLEQQGQQ